MFIVCRQENFYEVLKYSSIVYNLYTNDKSHWSNRSSVRQRSDRPGFNPKSIHTKYSKIALFISLLNTQYNKVGINDKVEQSRESSSAFRYTSV